MAVAGKSGIERDGGDILAVENSVERIGKALTHNVVVDRGADDLAEDTAQVERRQIGSLGKRGDGPFVRRRKRNCLFHPADGVHPAGKCGAPARTRSLVH